MITRKDIVKAALSAVMVLSAMTAIRSVPASAAKQPSRRTETTTSITMPEEIPEVTTTTATRSGSRRTSAIYTTARTTNRGNRFTTKKNTTPAETTPAVTDSDEPTTVPPSGSSGGNRRTDVIPVGAYAINEKNFPDEDFRSFVTKFDSDKDGILSKAEIARTTHIDVTGRNIKSFKGIEIFTNLEEFMGKGLSNTTLDLTGSSVKYLIWFDGKLKTLDVSGLSNIMQVHVESNNLTSLIIGNSPNMEAISCYDNKLTSIDVRGCPELKVLEAGNNKLSSIGLSNNKKLQILSLDKNSIKHVDLTENTEIKDLTLDPGITVTAKAGGYIESYAKRNGNEFVSASAFSLYKSGRGTQSEEYVTSFEKWNDAIKYINSNTTSGGYTIALNKDVLIDGKLTLPKSGACGQLNIVGRNGRKQLFFNDGNELYPDCDLRFVNIELRKSVVRGGTTYTAVFHKISSGNNKMMFENSRITSVGELRSNVDMYFTNSDIFSEIIVKDHVVFRGINYVDQKISAKGLVFEGNCDFILAYSSDFDNMKIGKDGIRYDTPVNFLYSKPGATVDKYSVGKKAGDLSALAYDLSKADKGYRINWSGKLPFESSAFNVLDSKGNTSEYQFAIRYMDNIMIDKISSADRCVIKFRSGASVRDGKVRWYNDKEKDVTIYITYVGYYVDNLMNEILKKYYDTKVTVESGVVNEHGTQLETRMRFRECDFNVSFTYKLRQP